MFNFLAMKMQNNTWNMTSFAALLRMSNAIIESFHLTKMGNSNMAVFTVSTNKQKTMRNLLSRKIMKEIFIGEFVKENFSF